MPVLLLLCRVRQLLPALLISWLMASAVQAQPEPVKFGQVDARDLTAAPFVADSGAAAVVLCDYGSTSIVNSSGLHFERLTRIKILNKAGLRWANIEVPLRHSQPGFTEQLTNLKGYTYNLVNGAVVQTPLATQGTFLSKESDLYSLQRFALPDVREGSVIEFRYTINSNYLMSLRGWEFQQTIPVRWSEYRAALPHQFIYKMFVQAKQPLAVEEQKNEKTLLPTFRWAMRDVPALRAEPFMTTTSDYVDKVFFELANYGSTDITQSWAKIDQYILKDWELGQQLGQAAFMKADLARLPAPTPDNARLRLAAVRAMVTAAVRCTGETGMRTSVPLRKIYQETHLGTAAEVNFLLIEALRKAGFAANPMLLSTRAHGRVRATLPELSQFNYVAAHVQLADGQELVLDATDPLLPYDMLPERCLNQQGRLVMGTAGASRWIELKPRHRHTHLQQIQLRLAPDGTLNGQVHEEFSGYAGAQLRDDLQTKGDKKFTASITSQLVSWEVSGFAVANRDSVQKPLAMDYAVAHPATASPGALPSTLYLSPMWDFGILRNPFRAQTRLYPVDFGYAREEILVLNLTLPDGYTLAEIPKSKALDLADNGGRYVCSTTAAGTTVQLTSRLVLRKPVYTAAEYQSLRELFRMLLEKHAEKLIVTKKA